MTLQKIWKEIVYYTVGLWPSFKKSSYENYLGVAAYMGNRWGKSEQLTELIIL